MAEQVHLDEGVIQAEIPPAALELFDSPSHDHVFYSISGTDGTMVSGYFDFQKPSAPIKPEEMLFYETELRDQRIYAVAFAQPVFEAPRRGQVLILVGQTLEGRHALARDIWIQTIRGHLEMLLLAALILWFGLGRGLHPLLELCNQLAARKPGELEQLSPRGLPTELKPLARVVNDYVARLDAHISAHGRFIADASHQLRTPLALLNTQVTYAIQNKDEASSQEILTAIHECVQHSVRLVNQLLAFDMAQAGVGRPLAQVPVDLVGVVRQAIEAQATVAARRNIDLGVEGAQAPTEVLANPVLLHELVANLVDNALRYTPPGGRVTVCVLETQSSVALTVTGNGHGIPENERENVFRRFYRLDNGHSDGCGLGLAIVREIATSCGAHITLGSPDAGTGLVVCVQFPQLSAAPNNTPRLHLS